MDLVKFAWFTARGPCDLGATCGPMPYSVQVKLVVRREKCKPDWQDPWRVTRSWPGQKYPKLRQNNFRGVNLVLESIVQVSRVMWWQGKSWAVKIPGSWPVWPVPKCQLWQWTTERTKPSFIRSMKYWSQTRSSLYHLCQYRLMDKLSHHSSAQMPVIFAKSRIDCNTEQYSTSLFVAAREKGNSHPNNKWVSEAGCKRLGFSITLPTLWKLKN